MKVVMTQPDQAGCGHYRVKYPGEVVRSQGYEVEYVTEIKGKERLIEGPGGMKVPTISGVDELNCDVVVMQRPLRRTSAEMIPFIQAQGAAVVVDVDDDFTCIDPRHMGWKQYQKKYNLESNREWLSLACKMADLVTVTTPALARRYGAHGRVQVLPNQVPESYLEIERTHEQKPTIGWPGHMATHPGDLQATRGGVAQVVKDGETRFLNIGRVRENDDLAGALGFDSSIAWAATGPIAFEDYPQECARLDVGIVPLADTAFNAAKSALKGLELAAVGVPFVSSPTADYRRIAADGIGITAKSRGRNWAGALRRLLGEEEGAEVAARGREAIREGHTYEKEGWRWAEAWDHAIRTRRESYVSTLEPNPPKMHTVRGSALARR